jgi:hypothetical protein
MEETKKRRPNPPSQKGEEGPPCPETFNDIETLAVCGSATGRVVSVFVSGSNGLGLGGRIGLFLEPNTVYDHLVHLVVQLPGRGFAHTMRSIHGATVRDRRRRRRSSVPKSLREAVPIHPQLTLTELGPFVHLTVDTILFGNDRRWKPLIICGQLGLGAVVLGGGTMGDVGAFYGLPKGGRGIGDGVVRTSVGGGVGHEGSPRRLRERGVWRTPGMKGEKSEVFVNKRRSDWDQGKFCQAWFSFFFALLSYPRSIGHERLSAKTIAHKGQISTRRGPCTSSSIGAESC